MINFHKKYRRYYPILLFLSILLIVIGDNLYKEKDPKPPLPHNNTALGGDHNHSDHDDPEKQKRMGIFHYNEGNRFFKEGNFREAITNYKMAQRHDPENENFYINLSSAYLKEKNFEKAYETLMALKTRSPRRPLLYYNLACYFSLKNDIERAKEALREGVGLGFSSFNEIQTDPDLKNLQKSEGFAKWLENLEGDSGKL